MAIRHATVIAAAMLGMVSTAPAAHAADPGIMFRFSPSGSAGQLGQLVVATVCEAIAMPGVQTQVPLAIEITCWIEDVADTESAMMAPGALVAAPLAVVMPAPVWICARATAAFLETEPGRNEILSVTDGTCIELLT